MVREEKIRQRKKGRCGMRLFDDVNQNVPWRNKVAKQLNNILARVEYVQETSNDGSDQDFATAALAIVDRVAEFEEIEAVPE
jgi:hypothetical protein